jgi:hypothetical protein
MPDWCTGPGEACDPYMTWDMPSRPYSWLISQDFTINHCAAE